VPLYAKGDGWRGCATLEYCCVDMSISSGSGVAVPAAGEVEEAPGAGEALGVGLAVENQQTSMVVLAAVGTARGHTPGTSFSTSRSEAPPCSEEMACNREAPPAWILAARRSRRSRAFSWAGDSAAGELD
jgi:hypothetical protein